MTTTHRQLVLYPSQVTDVLPVAVLCTTLADLKLIAGPAHPDWPQRYLIGERFLQYLNFMGCSPAVEFSPKDRNDPDWTKFTFVSVTSVLESPRCLVDPVMARPGCPSCGKRHAISANTAFSPVVARLMCPKCQQVSALTDWEWREFGGCARQFITIVNVYPKEALPTDALLQDLQTKTGMPWRYFYINAELLDLPI